MSEEVCVIIKLPPGLSTLKRGSIQVQRAAKVVNGKNNKKKLTQGTEAISFIIVDQIGSRQVLAAFVITGFVLCGIVEQSASVALRANSTSSISAEEFAEYVENTSYITQYCQPDNRNRTAGGHVVRSIPHIEVIFF